MNKEIKLIIQTILYIGLTLGSIFLSVFSLIACFTVICNVIKPIWLMTSLTLFQLTVFGVIGWVAKLNKTILIILFIISNSFVDLGLILFYINVVSKFL